MCVFSLIFFEKLFSAISRLQVTWIDEALTAPIQLFWLGVPAQPRPAGTGGEVFTWSERNIHWERNVFTYICLWQEDPGKLFSPASVNHSDCLQRETEVSLSPFFFFLLPIVFSEG